MRPNMKYVPSRRSLPVTDPPGLSLKAPRPGVYSSSPLLRGFFEKGCNITKKTAIATPLLLGVCWCLVARICFCAQNPGSVDEGFVPSVPGPVRDLATTPDDRVIVVFLNESTADGTLVLFDRDGQHPIAASSEPDVWAARWSRTNLIT